MQTQAESTSHRAIPPTADLYLDLLAGVLTRTILPAQYSALRGSGWTARAHSLIHSLLGHYNLELTRKPDPAHRELGKDFPLDAETMVGMTRLRDLGWCVEQVHDHGVPGDFIETGVWRGGACIFMRAVLKAYEISDRTVWVADSFQGMPATDISAYPVDAADTFGQWDKIAVSFEEVQQNFRRYGLLDEQVRFVPGWFSVSLPLAPIERLSILRLDCDLYSSTTEVLNSLYHKVSIGGYVVVDDYGIVTCRRAIDDFRRQNDITDELVDIDGAAVRWQRSH